MGGAGQQSRKTPGKALKNLLNKTPLFGSKSKSRLEATDATIDIGALMRNKLLVAPKLRGQSEERDTIPAALSQPAHAAAAAALPAAAPAATAQPPAAPAPRQQSPTPDSPVPPQANLSQLDVTDNPAFSPDDSLAKAQAKLASLKAAADMLKQTSAATAGRPQSGAAASLSAASFKFTATTGAAAAAAPAAATEPAGPRVAGMPAPVQPSPTPPLPQPSESPSLAHALQGRTRRAAPAATPEYRPEEDADEEDAQQLEEEAAAELAARSALQKRHRRRSVHPQRSSRFGEWFTGGDEELDKTLQIYNLEEAEPRVRRSQRRKSAFPTLGKLQAAEESEEEVRVDAATGGYGGAVVKEMAPRRAGTRRKTLAPGDDVAARVAAVTDELCAKLDGLIEPEPEEPNEKGRRRPEDDKSLRDKLVESWDGHSYYDRLLQMSQGEKECGGSTEAAAAAAAAGGDGNAQPHATTKRPPSPGMAQQRQLNELASDLQSLKVSARQGASAAGVAAPTEKKREAELPAEAAPASKFQRANKAQRAAAAAAPAPAAAAAATLAANDSQGQQAAAAEACATVSGASEAEHKLRAELAAAYEMLNAALADKGKLEGRLKAAKRDLADERDARAAAVEEAEAAKGALQEEIKSRKAAEKKVKDLGWELAEAKKRAAEATEGSARSVAGAVDRLAELEARCGGALEAQLAAVLKAANTLQKEVAVVKADAHAAGELLRGGSGSENGGSRSAVKAPSRQGWR